MANFSLFYLLSLVVNTFDQQTILQYIKTLNQMFLKIWNMSLKSPITIQMIYVVWTYVKISNHVDLCYWQYYNELVILQKPLSEIHFQYFLPYLFFFAPKSFCSFRYQKLKIVLIQIQIPIQSNANFSSQFGPNNLNVLFYTTFDIFYVKQI